MLQQSDRDETLCRTRRTSKQADRTCAQLVEAKCHISELKAQLANAVEHKITALERARKIDELTNRNLELENENGRLMSQITTDKMRCRSAVDCSMEHKRRDDQIIHVRHFFVLFWLDFLIILCFQNSFENSVFFCYSQDVEAYKSHLFGLMFFLFF